MKRETPQRNKLLTQNGSYGRWLSSKRSPQLATTSLRHLLRQKNPVSNQHFLEMDFHQAFTGCIY